MIYRLDPMSMYEIASAADISFVNIIFYCKFIIILQWLDSSTYNVFMDAVFNKISKLFLILAAQSVLASKCNCHTNLYETVPSQGRKL